MEIKKAVMNVEEENLKLVKMLKWPEGKVDVILDTDTYNEVDDQFALAYMLRSEEKLNVKAVYAAPFFNQKSNGPEDGMLKSYDEIGKMLKLLDREDMMDKVYLGSRQFLPSETKPVQSDAANDLARRAMDYTQENPLYVLAIGAITNISSALLINPEIKDRMVVVWLGGNGFEWPDNYEFNARQDVAAVRVLLGCGVPVVLLPCRGVVSAFSVSGPELEYWLRGKNELCDYLVETTLEYAKEKGYPDVWTKPIWDVTTVGWLLNRDYFMDRLVPSPIAEYDHKWAFDQSRHMIRYVYYINRDLLFQDLFRKLVK
ncbi:nucleoside hydrolase [Clostridium sp. chh4-2]|uniref:nucleoside hydrolase n=1 Tax=Clostridium sp. chh4-2 TaxID=2067550 RepID=UPI001FA916B5|nr:nucleoside hydrolase [Clostridium sp. chh4-2]